MRLIKVLAVLILQACYCRSLRQCCNEHTVWAGGANCTDGSRVLLNCSVGMYKLDPRDDPTTDNFTIFEEELEIGKNLERMPSHRFCLALDHGSPIALVCFEDNPGYNQSEAEGGSGPWRTILLGTLCALSVLCLYATLSVYVVLPELRDLQGKILMSAMSSLLAAYVMLTATQLTPDFFMYHDTTCTLLGFSMYYCCMAAFFWLNLVAFNVWRSVWFNRTLIKEETLYWIFSSIGWGAPLIFLAFAIMGQHRVGGILDPGFGVYRCWFEGPHTTWVYIYGPVACLMTLNILYFSLTCYELWHKYRGFSGTKLRILRFKCLLYLKLLLVMGLTWTFEVISYATGQEWINYWIATDILNSLQGMVIFVLLIATRKRVRKLLAKRRPFGINFPKSWAAGEDEECEVVLPDEELELSQAG